MPNIPDRLADAAYVANSATIVGSAIPANKRFLIQSAVATNSNGSGTVTIDVHLVPSGGSAAATNKFVSAKSIDQNGDKRLYQIEGQTLRAGDAVYATCSAASSVTLRISGRYLSGDGIS